MYFYVYRSSLQNLNTGYSAKYCGTEVKYVAIAQTGHHLFYQKKLFLHDNHSGRLQRKKTEPSYNYVSPCRSELMME